MNVIVRAGVAAALMGVGFAAGRWSRLPGADAQEALRSVTIRAAECTFTPNLIEAARNDRIRITLIALDAPYSFTLDHFRIARRFSPGHDGVVEFLATRAGRFVFYDTLARDRCSGMQGELVVHEVPAR